MKTWELKLSCFGVFKNDSVKKNDSVIILQAGLPTQTYRMTHLSSGADFSHQLPNRNP